MYYPSQQTFLSVFHSWVRALTSCLWTTSCCWSTLCWTCFSLSSISYSAIWCCCLAAVRSCCNWEILDESSSFCSLNEQSLSFTKDYIKRMPHLYSNPDWYWPNSLYNFNEYKIQCIRTWFLAEMLIQNVHVQLDVCSFISKI